MCVYVCNVTLCGGTGGAGRGRGGRRGGGGHVGRGGGAAAGPRHGAHAGAQAPRPHRARGARRARPDPLLHHAGFASGKFYYYRFIFMLSD